MSHKLTVFLDKDGVINDGLYWANYTKELLELLTYNDDIQVYWATTWFWTRDPKNLFKSWDDATLGDMFKDVVSYQDFYYRYYIIGHKEFMGKYYPEWDGISWEDYKEKTKDFYKVVDDFYSKCKWHPMREKKTTILEVLEPNEPFLWIEDGNPKDEIDDILSAKNSDYYYVNLDKIPDQLLVIRNYINGKLLK